LYVTIKKERREQCRCSVEKKYSQKDKFSSYAKTFVTIYICHTNKHRKALNKYASSLIMKIPLFCFEARVRIRPSGPSG
jgi:hypothetical protein